MVEAEDLGEDLEEAEEDLEADLEEEVLEEAVEKCLVNHCDAPSGTNFNWFPLKKVFIILIPIWPMLILGKYIVVISRNFLIIQDK